jgi:hypothetical protein
MADAADSKSVARKGVWVQVPPPAFENKVFVILRIRGGGQVVGGPLSPAVLLNRF